MSENENNNINHHQATSKKNYKKNNKNFIVAVVCMCIAIYEWTLVYDNKNYNVIMLEC